MKHAYLLLLLLALPGRSQNFRPFRPGRLMQYSRVSNDTTVALQLSRVGYISQAGDSAYDLNPQLLTRRYTPPTVCSGYNLFKDNINPLIDWVELHNQVSTQPVYKLNGYVRISSQYVPISITLKPRAPLGQAWPTDAGTAAVIARRLAQVLGQSDSLVDIELRDGMRNLTITLSKTYGLLTAYTMDEMVNGGRSTVAPPPHTCTALPQLRLGAAKIGARAVYDFQVGDVFLYQYVASAPQPAPTPFAQVRYYYGDSVLARTNSSTSDAVTYQMYSRSWATGTRTVSTYSVTFSSANSAPFSRPTGSVYRDPNTRQLLHFLPAVASTQYAQRAVQKLVAYNVCQRDTSWLAPTPIDIGYQASYGAGLGLVSRQIENFYPNFSSLNLVAYRKGTEQVGSLAPWYQGVLSGTSSRPAATTTAYPQPFGDNLMLKFDLARPQPVALALHDALGRVVLARPAASLPGGAQQLALDTHHLPAGLYALHLTFEGEGRTEVLKILKGND